MKTKKNPQKEEIVYQAKNKAEFTRVGTLLLELDISFRACLADKTIRISK